MNKIVTIMKKELSRFFQDKKLVVSTLILPGLLIYVMYSFMGSGMMNRLSSSEEYTPTIVMYNIPETMQSDFEKFGYNYSDEDLSVAIQGIEDKTLDAVITFPENFDQLIVSGEETPNIEIYYNSTKIESNQVYYEVSEYLNVYENRMSNVFDINNKIDSTYDLASAKDQTGSIFAMMLPMLLMIFIFTGCMSVAPESIAGEKERGTMATLLVTPMKRSQLAIGKIISLSIISLLSGISSFAGTILSLPKLMGGDMLGVSAFTYTFMDYTLLLLIILSSVLVIISLISIISSYAKSVKEASTYVMPLMMIVMFIGISSMMMNGTPNIMTSFIPLYNSVVCMHGIFSFSYQPLFIAITCISNLIYTFVLVYILTKLFDNEKVMF